MRQRSVLITGCSVGGIGHAFVKEFHSRGFKVFATARRPESMSELKGLEGVVLLKLDVSEIDSIRTAVDEVASLTGGKLDILMNNAGQGKPNTLYISPSNTSSISGVVHFPFNGAYNMSKAALNSLADALRIELAPFDNIKVVNLITGAVKSNIHRSKSLPDSSLYKPMEKLYHEKRLQMSKVKAMPTVQYAQQVASEVLKPKPRAWFWLANMTTVSWLLNTFFPKTLLDKIMARQFGLNEFAARSVQKNIVLSPNVKRTVLITGCSAGGIGHALAKEFHSRGERVFATARNLESMVELERLGITVLKLDVTKIESIRDARDKLSVMTGGKLDILVNNAGQESIMAVSDMDMIAARNLFEVNLYGAIAMVQEFVQLLIMSGNGRVAHVGSIAGIFPLPFSASYNGSKAAVHALSNTLRVELAPFNIKVVNLLTGGVTSNISRPLFLPENSLYRPIEQILLQKRVGISQAMPTAQYARRVATELLDSKPRAWFWLGDKSSLCWIFDTFLWKTSLDGIFIKSFGLSELAGYLRGRKLKAV
ncbi:short chain dehydrogenase reductase [Lentinula edodes]|uniref:Short chain dehydrogenase reductase n=1 Tax=Lentinula edodes TaxID=5353 RepID=A0A1Q3E1V8_LENED|nr:short chain dehydrogenase reductase [Lentinula edodes]